MLLDKIEKANDIKKIDKSDYGELAEEIRQFLIQKISVTGGHLGSNLGAVAGIKCIITAFFSFWEPTHAMKLA